MFPSAKPSCVRVPFMKLPASLVCGALAASASLAPLSLSAESRSSWKFDFGPGAVADGFTAVRADSVYSAAAGFGFEPGVELVGIDRGAPDALRGDYLVADRPFLFSAAVPEGNYRVTVTLGDHAGESNTTIKAESRRLMVERIDSARGKFPTAVFTVNVRNSAVPPPERNAPGGSAVVLNDREQGALHWDDKLTLEFNGPAPKVCAVEIERVECPTVFLLGDSTVTDQRSEPGASWGQMLPRFLKPGVAVANHAESGETIKSFISGLRLAKVLSQVKAGDYLFVQFGHNDSKKQWPQTYAEAHTTYPAYLRVLIAEARLRGATPVLVTSMQRRNFDAKGKIVNSHGDYPAAVREVAKSENVALIDLELASVALYEALGTAGAPRLFGNDGKDITHHNNYGAYEFAKCVAQGIRAARLPLAEFLADDFAGFDPAQPDPVDGFKVPASASRSDLAPRGN